MNILITGGCGFIGSHVAEKFYQEGYDVYIIDNLSTGNLKNINFKHTFFNLDILDPKCNEIFKRFRFDAVIHLAAQINVVSSLKNPYQDTQSNILGLTNILQLSAQYGIKKLIFSSSAAVYGNNQNIPLLEDDEVDPLSPYGMSKLTGELYCKKWKNLYGLDTTCFRFSNVYGPRQGTNGEGGVISIFLENLVDGKEFVVFGDGNQTRDFIFVKDVAEAIYRAFHSEITGVYNLSTNTQSSVNDILKVLDGYLPIQEMRYCEPREGDIKHSCLDNSKMKNILQWSPTYTLEEGLKKTYAWYIDDYKTRYKSKVKEDKKPSQSLARKQQKSTGKQSSILAYLENLLFFALISFLTIMLQSSTNQYVIDFKLIYIVIISSVHGLKQAVLSSILSCALYIYIYLEQGRSINSIVEGTNDLLILSLYMLIGIVVGYMIDSKNMEIKAKNMVLLSEEEKYAFLNKQFEEIVMIKEELYEQVISTQDSYGKVYSMLMQLEGLDPKAVFSGGITILEDIMKSNKVSIYILSDLKSAAVLSAKSEKMDLILPGVLKVRDRVDIQEVIETKEVFVNRELLPNLPIMSAPIIVNGDVTAVASVYHVEFENITLYRQNLFAIVVKLISYSLQYAYRYLDDLEDEHTNYSMMAEIGSTRVKQTNA